MANKNIQLIDTTGNNLFPVIADNSVITSKLKDKSVTTAKLADDVITVINNIKDSITTEANTAREAEKANKDAINVLNADNNITTNKLKDNNVTWDKLSYEVQNNFTTLKNIQDTHDADIKKLKKQAVNMVVISQEDYNNLVLSGTVDANTYYNVFE